ncbi:MAG: glutamate racemase [Desulfobacteraceae bacterium]|nr:glutamate racemase [Desulfobacteraceae bacterium]MBU4001488.1 glutamate racemase [Pseudomonadota bacterium]
MSNDDPIGLFDSGIGGLSVLQRIREVLPHENVIYVSDAGHLPYGDKPRAYIEKRCFSLTDFLIQNKAKAIVVACNTATAAAIETLRGVYTLPVIGVEPGVKPGLAVTQTGVVGILATTETLKSRKFENLVSRFCNDCKVVVQECPGLVEQIEHMDLSGEKTVSLVKRYVASLLDQGADTLVLGCTHYPLISDLIESVAGNRVRVIDTGFAVAREVVRRLTEAELLSTAEKPGTEIFWTTGNLDKMEKLVNYFWNKPSEVKALCQAGETGNPKR